MSSPPFDISLICPRLNKALTADMKVIEALPRWARWPMPYRFVRQSSGALMVAAVGKALPAASIKQRGIAYIWAFESIPLVRSLRRKGVLSIWEKTNCHRGTAKRILDDAYTRAGVAPAHGISEASVAHEMEFLAELDYVFCPNSLVAESLREHDVPDSKLLPASYGWDPSRCAPIRKPAWKRDGITFAFVGSISIRKGAHLLLKYWAKSGIKGRLLLAGAVEPAVATLCGSIMNRNDIVLCGYVADVAAVYQSADVFVFPTLEEGGPMVTYEAAGCGLPIVTTSMGAAGIVENEVNGYILDPYDTHAWVHTLRRLASSPELRDSLGAAVRESAAGFTWAQVGKRRRERLLEVLCTGPAGW